VISNSTSSQFALVTEPSRLAKRDLLLFDRIFLLRTSPESLTSALDADIGYLQSQGVAELLPDTLEGLLGLAVGTSPVVGGQIAPSFTRPTEIVYDVAPGFNVGAKYYDPTSVDAKAALAEARVPPNSERFVANMFNSLIPPYHVVPRLASMTEFSSVDSPLQFPSDLDDRVWFCWQGTGEPSSSRGGLSRRGVFHLRDLLPSGSDDPRRGEQRRLSWSSVLSLCRVS
jgi:hypothetical protein